MLCLTYCYVETKFEEKEKKNSILNRFSPYLVSLFTTHSNYFLFLFYSVAPNSMDFLIQQLHPILLLPGKVLSFSLSSLHVHFCLFIVFVCYLNLHIIVVYDIIKKVEFYYYLYCFSCFINYYETL